MAGLVPATHDLDSDARAKRALIGAVVITVIRTTAKNEGALRAPVPTLVIMGGRHVGRP